MEPNNRFYEQLISSDDQSGGMWQHPIYGRRRRGGGAKLKRVLKLVRRVGSDIKDTGKRFLKNVVAKHGTAMATGAVADILAGTPPEAVLKSLVKNNKKKVVDATKAFAFEELGKRVKKGGGKKKKKKTSKKKTGGKKKSKKKTSGKKKGGKKKKKSSKRKQKGGRVKNRKQTSYSAGNQVSKRRVQNPYF